jgi:chromosome segregation ATPase
MFFSSVLIQSFFLQINRLKKTIDRLNKTTIHQKQAEHQTEVSREKLQNEIDELREKNSTYEDTFLRLKREREQLLKEIENKNSLINSIHLKIKNFLGKNSSNIENDFNELDNQWKTMHFKCKSLEEKLIERDNGTLQLTQKLEEQVLHFKHDLEQKHKVFLTQREQLLQRHQNDIQNLTIQLQNMEIRANEAEHRLNNENQSKNQLMEQTDKFNLILKHLISIYIPLRRRYFQLIDSNKLIKQEFYRFNQIKQMIHSNTSIKNRFRIAGITIIALKRFSLFKNNSSLTNIPSSNTIYDQKILSSFNMNFIQTINYNDIFQSLIIQLNRLYSPIIKG